MCKSVNLTLVTYSFQLWVLTLHFPSPLSHCRAISIYLLFDRSCRLTHSKSLRHPFWKQLLSPWLVAFIHGPGLAAFFQIYSNGNLNQFSLCIRNLAIQIIRSDALLHWTLVAFIHSLSLAASFLREVEIVPNISLTNLIRKRNFYKWNLEVKYSSEFLLNHLITFIHMQLVWGLVCRVRFLVLNVAVHMDGLNINSGLCTSH